jgi:hypothetical protein
MWYWIRRISGIKATKRNEPVEVPMRVIIAAVALGMLVGVGTAPERDKGASEGVTQAESVSAQPMQAEFRP